VSSVFLNPDRAIVFLGIADYNSNFSSQAIPLAKQACWLIIFAKGLVRSARTLNCFLQPTPRLTNRTPFLSMENEAGHLVKLCKINAQNGVA
jgi:hypothetical protein